MCAMQPAATAVGSASEFILYSDNYENESRGENRYSSGDLHAARGAREVELACWRYRVIASQQRKTPIFESSASNEFLLPN